TRATAWRATVNAARDSAPSPPLLRHRLVSPAPLIATPWYPALLNLRTGLVHGHRPLLASTPDMPNPARLQTLRDAPDHRFVSQCWGPIPSESLIPLPLAHCYSLPQI